MMITVEVIGRVTGSDDDGQCENVETASNEIRQGKEGEDLERNLIEYDSSHKTEKG